MSVKVSEVSKGEYVECEGEYVEYEWSVSEGSGVK